MEFDGICLVTAVLAHGMLSVPYPFQLLHTAVPTFIVASFRSSVLTVLVPIAYLLHSFRSGAAWPDGQHARASPSLAIRGLASSPIPVFEKVCRELFWRDPASSVDLSQRR